MIKITNVETHIPRIVNVEKIRPDSADAEWILKNGYWDDDGVWIDSETWQDS